ncbi:hypothetical protein PoB_001493100 [Plakobranchus ocellatus]|uniref:Secreted protein n=1 Tax=Plakobranchus ocellatus TaxID=259542 RepID=A0AAV3YY10_9GAST|nr:hypothetical protein PoB_001493100 [Plakobranchus ocellatus]
MKFRFFVMTSFIWGDAKMTQGKKQWEKKKGEGGARAAACNDVMTGIAPGQRYDVTRIPELCSDVEENVYTTVGAQRACVCSSHYSCCWLKLPLITQSTDRQTDRQTRTHKREVNNHKGWPHKYT